MIYQPQLSDILREQIEKLNLLERVLTCEGGTPTFQNRVIEHKGIPPAHLDTPSSKFIYYTSYTAQELGLETSDLELPFDTYFWWCIKTMPGQFLPLHTDPAVMKSEEPTTRYWSMLQDYIPGHCFIINEELFTDYKAGDVFLWDDSTAEHGAFNMSGVPRVSFQIGIGGEYSKTDMAARK